MSKKIPKKKRYCIEKLVNFDSRFNLEKWESTRICSNNLISLYPWVVKGYRIWDSEENIEIKPYI